MLRDLITLPSKATRGIVVIAWYILYSAHIKKNTEIIFYRPISIRSKYHSDIYCKIISNYMVLQPLKLVFNKTPINSLIFLRNFEFKFQILILFYNMKTFSFLWWNCKFSLYRTRICSG